MGFRERIHRGLSQNVGVILDSPWVKIVHGMQCLLITQVCI